MKEEIKGFFLDDLIRKFVIGASTCHTIDCVLIRLSSALAGIKDFTKDLPYFKEEEIFREFLENPKTKKVLRILAYNQVATSYLIQSDPRFKNLRTYLPLILNIIEQIPHQQTTAIQYKETETTRYVEEKTTWKTDPYLMDLLRKFIIGASTSHTIDGVLIRLSSLVTAIKDLAQGLPSYFNEEKLFKEFLQLPEVRKQLTLLACNPEETQHLILYNPRFKNLRPHIQYIINTITTIPCTIKTKPKEKHYKPITKKKPVLTRSEAQKIRRRRKLKKIATIITIIILLGTIAYLNQLNPLFPQILSRPPGTPGQQSIINTQIPVQSTTQQPAIVFITTRENIDINKLRQYALAILNNERIKHNLPTLQLFNPTPNPAQIHAEELVKYNYISHWNKEGLKPNMRWAKYGYTWFGVSESIAITQYLGTVHWTENKLKDEIKSAIINMIYNDEESNWGHRDDLLNPVHNKVAIGIAWDGDTFAIVINCINDHIKWIQKPIIRGGKLIMEGTISTRFITEQCTITYNVGNIYSRTCTGIYCSKPQSIYSTNKCNSIYCSPRPSIYDKGKPSIYQMTYPSIYGNNIVLTTTCPYLDIYIYRDETPRPLNNPEGEKPSSWDIGTIVAGILPKNSQYYYKDIPTIYADYTTTKTGNQIKFKLVLDLNKIQNLGPGIYGIYIMIKDNTYKHPYLRGDYVYPATNILIEVTLNGIYLFK